MSHIVGKVEREREADGRWIAEIVDVRGVMAYGATEKEAVASAQALALRILADGTEPNWRLDWTQFSTSLNLDCGIQRFEDSDEFMKAIHLA